MTGFEDELRAPETIEGGTLASIVAVRDETDDLQSTAVRASHSRESFESRYSQRSDGYISPSRRNANYHEANVHSVDPSEINVPLTVDLVDFDDLKDGTYLGTAHTSAAAPGYGHRETENHYPAEIQVTHSGTSNLIDVTQNEMIHLEQEAVFDLGSSNAGGDVSVGGLEHPVQFDESRHVQDTYDHSTSTSEVVGQLLSQDHLVPGTIDLTDQRQEAAPDSTTKGKDKVSLTSGTKDVVRDSAERKTCDPPAQVNTDVSLFEQNEHQHKREATGSSEISMARLGEILGLEDERISPFQPPGVVLVNSAENGQVLVQPIGSHAHVEDDAGIEPTANRTSDTVERDDADGKGDQSNVSDPSVTVPSEGSMNRTANRSRAGDTYKTDTKSGESTSKLKSVKSLDCLPTGNKDELTIPTSSSAPGALSDSTSGQIDGASNKNTPRNISAGVSNTPNAGMGCQIRNAEELCRSEVDPDTSLETAIRVSVQSLSSNDVKNDGAKPMHEIIHVDELQSARANSNIEAQSDEDHDSHSTEEQESQKKNNQGRHDSDEANSYGMKGKETVAPVPECRRDPSLVVAVRRFDRTNKARKGLQRLLNKRKAKLQSDGIEQSSVESAQHTVETNANTADVEATALVQADDHSCSIDGGVLVVGEQLNQKEKQTPPSSNTGDVGVFLEETPSADDADLKHLLETIAGATSSSTPTDLFQPDPSGTFAYEDENSRCEPILPPSGATIARDPVETTYEDEFQDVLMTTSAKSNDQIMKLLGAPEDQRRPRKSKYNNDLAISDYETPSSGTSGEDVLYLSSSDTEESNHAESGPFDENPSDGKYITDDDAIGHKSSQDSSDGKLSIVYTSESELEPGYDLYDACAVPFLSRLLDKGCAWLDGGRASRRTKSNPSLLHRLHRKSKKEKRSNSKKQGEGHSHDKKKHVVNGSTGRNVVNRLVQKRSNKSNPNKSDLKPVSVYARPRRGEQSESTQSNKDILDSKEETKGETERTPKPTEVTIDLNDEQRKIFDVRGESEEHRTVLDFSGSNNSAAQKMINDSVVVSSMEGRAQFLLQPFDRRVNEQIVIKQEMKEKSRSSSAPRPSGRDDAVSVSSTPFQKKLQKRLQSIRGETGDLNAPDDLVLSDSDTEEEIAVQNPHSAPSTPRGRQQKTQNPRVLSPPPRPDRDPPLGAKEPTIAPPEVRKPSLVVNNNDKFNSSPPNSKNESQNPPEDPGMPKVSDPPTGSSDRRLSVETGFHGNREGKALGPSPRHQGQPLLSPGQLRKTCTQEETDGVQDHKDGTSPSGAPSISTKRSRARSNGRVSPEKLFRGQSTSRDRPSISGEDTRDVVWDKDEALRRKRHHRQIAERHDDIMRQHSHQSTERVFEVLKKVEGIPRTLEVPRKPSPIKTAHKFALAPDMASPHSDMERTCRDIHLEGEDKKTSGAGGPETQLSNRPRSPNGRSHSPTHASKNSNANAATSDTPRAIPFRSNGAARVRTEADEQRERRSPRKDSQKLKSLTPENATFDAFFNHQSRSPTNRQREGFRSADRSRRPSRSPTKRAQQQCRISSARMEGIASSNPSDLNQEKIPTSLEELNEEERLAALELAEKLRRRAATLKRRRRIKSRRLQEGDSTDDQGGDARD